MTIHDLVAEQRRLRPGATAVTAGGTRVSYAELDAWADEVARRVLDRGVSPGARVAVSAERSAAYVAAVLGVLKAGCAYVPLDHGYPRARQDFILDDSGVALTLVSGGPAGDRRLVIPPPGERTAGGELPCVTRAQVAYLMYTSGSTGRPKGVLVEHQQVVSLVRNDERLHVRPGDKVALFAPLAFDASTFELWNTLCRGGELVVFQNGWDSVDDLGRELRAVRPDWLFLTSGLFHLLAEHDPAALDSVGRLITGGDVLSPRHVGAVAGRGTVRLFAAYGPTETTTFASLHEVDPDRSLVTVPIGRPLRGVRMYVMDEGRRREQGEIGELYIGGSGVARSYHDADDLTAAKFLPDPCGGRMYRTGDLARELPGGEFEFHGRVDRQVKIRGHRVEPGEVEAHLSAHPAVAMAVVSALEDPSGAKRLVAYLVPAGGQDVRIKDVRDWLAERCPAYMLPSSFVSIAELPLDANGKPDRGALPFPWSRRDDTPNLRPYRKPRNTRERLIAAVWAEVLGLDHVGLDDDFYDLGGDSLRSVDLLARLRKEGITLSALALFRNPTVGDLAASLDEPEVA
ncbi:non-ribosomal peptide synthetase [Nonomuraea sp. NPDC049725]|uniref:non-ribosomal peptide synthetase n=1 Tax=Nonomuraea sp. NPDC049725 TaxID=3154508 RepID=UPI0034458EE3